MRFRVSEYAVSATLTFDFNFGAIKNIAVPKGDKMIKPTTRELRETYLKFFADRGHKIIPSASLVPENDPTVLFTTAGMHPLVIYLAGQKHPEGNRLADVQKCVRTGDIDKVGDSVHCTFFEMLGNWSFGDYFKKESITWSYEFLTEVLEIPPEKLAVSVFEGDEDCPRDVTSAALWKNLGIAEKNIFYLPKENNWWGPAGLTGPCGPDTEIFFITNGEKCSENCSPACDCGRYVEIWNNVFMEFEKTAEGKYIPLKQKNVDTGMGLERTAAVLNGFESVYETDVLSGAMKILRTAAGNADTRTLRIICDHVRTSTFLLGDQNGVTPSNVDRGYVLRRLIRRAIRYMKTAGCETSLLSELAENFIETYAPRYPELKRNEEKILSELRLESERFEKTLTAGLKEFEKLLGYIRNNRISGKAAFRLYDTFGFPLEMTVELAEEKGVAVDTEGFAKAFAEHKEKSHAGAEQRFKGGLADGGVLTARLHTATHLLNAALKKVLNDDAIEQRGSNITAERLRFDFNFPRPLTSDEIAEVEKTVNEAIEAKIPVTCREMPLDEAKKTGAVGVFGDRYGERVKVYSIENFSVEICGGPHAANTSELGKFKIIKEQSSSAGIRRIKAVLSED